MMPTDLTDVAYAVGAGTVVIAAAMIDVSDPVIVTIGATILGGLTAAIKILWNRNNTLSTATEKALSDCEAKHVTQEARYDVLVQQVIKLTAEVSNMEGRIAGFQEATDKAERREVAREAANHGQVPPGK